MGCTSLYKYIIYIFKIYAQHLYPVFCGDRSGSPWCHWRSPAVGWFADWVWRCLTPVWPVACSWRCQHSQSDPACYGWRLSALLQCVNLKPISDDQWFQHLHLCVCGGEKTENCVICGCRNPKYFQQDPWVNFKCGGKLKVQCKYLIFSFSFPGFHEPDVHRCTATQQSHKCDLLKWL